MDLILRVGFESSLFKDLHIIKETGVDGFYLILSKHQFVIKFLLIFFFLLSGSNLNHNIMKPVLASELNHVKFPLHI